MRSFKPAGLHTVSIPGFINSLQMLSLPSQSVDEAGFSAPNDATDILGDINLNSTTSSQDRVDAEVEAEESTKKKTSKQSILLVAAVGQEPRLGRWMRIKDDVKNGALAVVLNLEA
jgi:ribosomal RNA-processing protein 9